jgi:hypothetical protein
VYAPGAELGAAPTQTMELKPYTIFSGICLSCAVITAGFAVARNQASVNANQARTAALSQITKYQAANNCWEVEGNSPVLIGNEIDISNEGKSPTACFFDTNSQRYIFAGYLNGKLQALYIFTPTEVKKGVPND